MCESGGEYQTFGDPRAFSWLHRLHYRSPRRTTGVELRNCQLNINQQKKEEGEIVSLINVSSTWFSQQKYTFLDFDLWCVLTECANRFKSGHMHLHLITSSAAQDIHLHRFLMSVLLPLLMHFFTVIMALCQHMARFMIQLNLGIAMISYELGFC